MKNFLTLLILILALPVFSTEIKEDHLTVTSGKIIFISEAPQEKIKGVGKQISGDVYFKEKKVKLIIDLSDWRTNNRLQTAHLHENYLETEKFSKADFEGVIDSYDSKTGLVSVLGAINLHGVIKKEVKIIGKVTSTDSGYTFSSEFSLNLKDYSIDVPKLLMLKVSEIVKLEVKIDLEPVAK